MADTYTTNLNLTKPEPGAAEDTWGISLNSDLDTLDAIFSSSGTQVNLNPNQVNFADGKKVIFGTGSDLSIYHDGSNSFIKDTGTGDLIIQGSNAIRLRSATGENMALFNANGASTLQYDNSTKLATTSTGIDVTGTVTSDGVNTDGNLNIISGQLQLGGSTTITNNKTAYLKGVYVSDAQPTLRLTDTDATNQYTDFFMSASYALFQNRNNTANGGFIFRGSNGSVNTEYMRILPSGNIGIGTSSPSATLDIVAASTNAVKISRADGNAVELLIESQNGDNAVTFSDGGTDKWSIGKDNTDSSFRLAQGGTLGVNDAIVVNSSRNVGIGTTSPNYELTVGGSDAINSIQLLSSTTGTGATNGLRFWNTGSSVAMWNYDNTPILFGTNNTERARIDASGNVGIGISSPSNPLDVAGIIRSTSTNPQLRIYTSSGTGQGYLIFGDSADDDIGQIVYNHNTDSMRFHTNASERVRIDSIGRLGIGTSSPSTGMHLSFGDSKAELTLERTGTNASSWSLKPYNSDFFIRESGTDRVTFKAGGSVGIGTTSPSAKLHIETGSDEGIRMQRTGTNANFSAIEFRNSDDTATNSKIGWNSNELRLEATSTYRVVTNSSDALLINSSGNVGIGLTSPTSPLTVKSSSTGSQDAGFTLQANGSTNAIFKVGEKSNGKARLHMFDGTTEKIAFYADGTANHISAGNLGIGISSPTEKFEVNGSINTSNQSSSFTTGNYRTFMDMINSSKIARIGTLKGANTPTGTQGSIYFTVNGATKSVLDQDGNFGINTTSPAKQLHVYQPSGQTGILLSRSNNITGVNLQLSVDSSKTRLLSYGDALSFWTAATGSGTNASERVRIDSSGKLGVNTTSLDGILTLKQLANSDSNGLDGIRINASTGTTYGGFGLANATGTLAITAGDAGGTEDTEIVFKTASSGSESERARIDSSGNLLVGTTSSANTTDGVRITSGGYITIAQDAASVPTLFLNKITNDGQHIQFQKDGSEIGSIATKDDNLYLGTGDTFVRFFDTDDAIAPVTSAGSTRDNAIDLGTSTRRFKDLHLSGTANVGGLDSSGVSYIRGASAGRLNLDDSGVADGSQPFKYLASDGGSLIFGTANRSGTSTTNSSEVARIDSSGNLGIGTSSPGEKLTVSGNTLTYGSTGNVGAGASYFLGNSQNSRDIALTRVGSATLGIGYYSGGWQESARFDSSGNFLVAQTSQSPNTVGISLNNNGNISAKRDGGIVALFNRATSSGEIISIRKDDTTVGSIGTGGTDLWIGSPAGAGSVGIKFNSKTIIPTTDTGADQDNAIDIGNSSVRFKDLHLSGTAYMGDLLVGKTSANIATVGFEATPSSIFQANASTADGKVAHTFNRKTSDGDVITFRKDGTTVGSIFSSGGIQCGIGDGNTALLFADNISALLPWSASSNSGMDDAIDLGRSATRFKDIYLGGNIILSGSSANEGYIYFPDSDIPTSTTFKLYHFNDTLFWNGESIDTTSTSDYRAKKDIQPLKDGLERVNKLNPVEFRYIKDDKYSEGFIAHELQEVWEHGVHGEKDGDIMQSVSYGRITPLLVKAIQEQQEQIESLKSEIAKLKGE